MIIRNMHFSDIEFAYQCTRGEGWVGETEDKFESLLSFNPGGCFVAEKDAQKIGICVATKYRTNGFIGELVVVKEMRHQGYGSRLFEHAIKYLRSNCIQNIYLDADLDAVSLYEKYGFRKVTRSLRFVGKLSGKNNSLVQQATHNDIENICKIDTQLFADDRSYFLRRRYQTFPNLCLVSKTNRTISGYILGRPGINVISVVPMAVLNDNVDPLELLEAFAHQVQNRPLRIGVLENNIKAAALFRSIRTLEEKEYCWRMLLGDSDKLGSSEKLYTIGSGAKG